MAWRSSGKTNKALIENLWTNGLITKEVVKQAFLKVDRAHYAPGSRPYEDAPQSIGHSATVSAPHMHASAVESLLPFLLPSASARPRRVLDIGSGSGYLTHILAELAGEDSVVVGVEHIQALKELGETNMAKSQEGRDLLRSGWVRFRVGDGRKGWVEPVSVVGSETGNKPTEIQSGSKDGMVGGTADESDEQGWDAIHVGAAASTLHDDLVLQLRRPGRMFIPVEDGENSYEQYIWVVDKDAEGNVSKKRMFAVRYVPLTDPPGA